MWLSSNLLLKETYAGMLVEMSELIDTPLQDNQTSGQTITFELPTYFLLNE